MDDKTAVFLPYSCVSSFPDGIRRRFSGLTREQAFAALVAYADAAHDGEYGPWSWVTDENYIKGEYCGLKPPPPVIDPPFPVLDLTDCRTEEERRKALQDPFDPDGEP